MFDTPATDGLLALVAAGTPSRLERFHINHGSSMTPHDLDTLTAAFQGGASPKLLHLHLQGRIKSSPPPLLFPHAWSVLGERIKLESLYVGLSSVAILPPHAYYNREHRDRLVSAMNVSAMNTRRWVRDLQAVAVRDAAAAEKARQQQHVAELEARVRELDAQLQQG